MAHYYDDSTRTKYYLEAVRQEYERIVSDPGSSSIKFLAEKTAVSLSELERIITEEQREQVLQLMTVYLLCMLYIRCKKKRFFEELLRQLHGKQLDAARKLYYYLFGDSYEIIDLLKSAPQEVQQELAHQLLLAKFVAMKEVQAEMLQAIHSHQAELNILNKKFVKVSLIGAIFSLAATLFILLSVVLFNELLDFIAAVILLIGVLLIASSW